MTNEQINALVAEKVLGLRRVPGPSTEDGTFHTDTFGTVFRCYGGREHRIYSPTSDWNAMGEVVEKIANRHPNGVIHITRRHDGVFRTTMQDGTQLDVAAWHRSAPLAVCLAALKALGVDIGAEIGGGQ